MTSAAGEVREITQGAADLGLAYEPTGRGAAASREGGDDGLTKSFMQYANVPSAVISDGIMPDPAVGGHRQVSLSQTYHLPPIGSTAQKAIVATHDDTVTLAGVLVGRGTLRLEGGAGDDGRGEQARHRARGVLGRQARRADPRSPR